MANINYEEQSLEFWSGWCCMFCICISWLLNVYLCICVDVDIVVFVLMLLYLCWCCCIYAEAVVLTPHATTTTTTTQQHTNVDDGSWRSVSIWIRQVKQHNLWPMYVRPQMWAQKQMRGLGIELPRVWLNPIVSHAINNPMICHLDDARRVREDEG